MITFQLKDLIRISFELNNAILPVRVFVGRVGECRPYYFFVDLVNPASHVILLGVLYYLSNL
jgi:hypothetical protein